MIFDFFPTGSVNYPFLSFPKELIYVRGLTSVLGIGVMCVVV